VAGLIYAQTGSERIEDYGGLGRRSPVMAVCMGAFMFSLVGLPPFGGFVAKLNVMYRAGEITAAGGGRWWWSSASIRSSASITTCASFA